MTRQLHGYKNRWSLRHDDEGRPYPLYLSFCEYPHAGEQLDLFHLILSGPPEKAPFKYYYKTDNHHRAFESDHPFVCERIVARQIWDEFVARGWVQVPTESLPHW